MAAVSVADDEAVLLMADPDLGSLALVGHDLGDSLGHRVTDEADADGRAVPEVGGMDDVDDREHVSARTASNEGEDDKRRPDEQRHSEHAEDREQDRIAVERRAARPG